jgi:hypothetical protein
VDNLALARVDSSAVSSYKLSAFDIQSHIRVAVTATNAYGSATAVSDATAKILP